MNRHAVLYALICANAAASQHPGQPDLGAAPPQTHRCSNLAIAANNGDVECVKTLLADPSKDLTDTVDSVDYALGCAVMAGRAGCVALLLKDPRLSSTGNINTEILRAAEFGRAECIRLLLADGRANLISGASFAVEKAAENGHTDCVRVLLADPRVKLDAHSRVLLMATAHPECVKLLLDDGRVDPTARKGAELVGAASEGYMDSVRLLLEDGRMDPAANASEPIRRAAENGHAGCVELLLADGRADPATRNNLPIYVAMQNGDVACAKVLLGDPRVDPSLASQIHCPPEIRGLTECILACRDGNLEALRQMDLTVLPDDELDVLIRRNRSFPEVQLHVLAAKLAKLGVPETVLEDPAYMALVSLARSRGFWGTAQLRELTRTFILLKNVLSEFDNLAGTLTPHAFGFVA